MRYARGSKSKSDGSKTSDTGAAGAGAVCGAGAAGGGSPRALRPASQISVVVNIFFSSKTHGVVADLNLDKSHLQNIDRTASIRWRSVIAAEQKTPSGGNDEPIRRSENAKMKTIDGSKVVRAPRTYSYSCRGNRIGRGCGNPITEIREQTCDDLLHIRILRRKKKDRFHLTAGSGRTRIRKTQHFVVVAGSRRSRNDERRKMRSRFSSVQRIVTPELAVLNAAPIEATSTNRMRSGRSRRRRRGSRSVERFSINW